LRDELRVEALAELDHLGELFAGVRVEGVIQTSGRGVLRKLRFRRQGVGRREMLIERVGLGQKLAGDGFEQVFVCHCDSPPRPSGRLTYIDIGSSPSIACATTSTHSATGAVK